MEKPQLLYLLQLLRDSLERSAARLPCVISVFLAKCSRTMIKPSTCDDVTKDVESCLCLRLLLIVRENCY